MDMAGPITKHSYKTTGLDLNICSCKIAKT